MARLVTYTGESIQEKWQVCVSIFLRCVQSPLSARVCFLHPHCRTLVGQTLAPGPAPCLLSISPAQPHLARLILTRAMGEFNLIIVRLVLCGYNTDFTDSIMLLRQGGLLNNSMTERLSVQVQSKQEPESFFSPHEPYSVLKPTFMKKYKQLSGSFISVKTVLVNCRDKVCTVTYIFMYAPNVLGPSLTAFCKHSHMWEWTSRHACLNVNTLSAPAGLVRSRNCSSRAAVPCGLRAGTR